MNYENIKQVKSPLLVIHGLKDEFIPHTQSKELLSACNSHIKQYLFSKEMVRKEVTDILKTHNILDFEEDIVVPFS